MIINFNEKEAVTIPGMNNGTGTMTAKMFMSDKGKESFYYGYIY